MKEKGGLFLKGLFLFQSLQLYLSSLYFLSFRKKSMAPCHAFCGLLLPVVSLYEKRMKISWKKWKPCKRISILQQTLSIIASLYIKVNIFLKRNTGYALHNFYTFVANSSWVHSRGKLSLWMQKVTAPFVCFHVSTCRCCSPWTRRCCSTRVFERAASKVPTPQRTSLHTTTVVTSALSS